MQVVYNHHSLNRYSALLGRDYTLFEKIKLFGTGSPKTIFIRGIEHLEQNLTSQSAKYSNFQLYPKALLVRNLKQNNIIGIILERSEIDKIEFVSRRIKVRVKGITHIVHDSKIDFKLKNSHLINFYSPTTFYKPLKTFFKKDWLKGLTNFSVDPSPPIFDKAGSLVSNFMRGFY